MLNQDIQNTVKTSLFIKQAAIKPAQANRPAASANVPQTGPVINTQAQARIAMSAAPKNLGLSSIFGSSVKATPSKQQASMSRFSTMKPQTPQVSNRSSISMLLKDKLSPSTFSPAMPPVQLRPQVNRTQTVMMAEESKEVDTFKDREFVVGETFEAWLDNSIQDKALKKVLISLAEIAFKEISDKIQSAATNKQGTMNEFGDEQLAIDVLADKVMFKALSSTFCVGAATSEETAEICNLPTYPDELENNTTGGFCCAFDPLDGSSIIDTNFAVGTIFGIWPGKNLIGVKGSEQAAAGMCVYGPRTQLTIALKDAPGTHEFILTKTGRWIRTLDMNSVNEGLMYSPGNLRAREDNAGYKELTNYWLDNGYRLRYSGGMVPDVNQILIKGFGVFTYPASAKHPAKLRCLYEVAPIGMLIEKAGGYTSEGEHSVLDTLISDVNQTSQCAFGSKDEVKRFEKMVGKKAFAPGEYDKKYVEMKD